MLIENVFGLPQARSKLIRGFLSTIIPLLSAETRGRRGRPRMSSPSTTSVGRASSGSRRARERSHGRGPHAALSPPTPSAFSSMPSLIVSATSCAPWRRNREPARPDTYLPATAGSQRHFILVKVSLWAQAQNGQGRHLANRLEPK
jgi:hypothetical protein